MQNLHHFTHRVDIQVYSVLQKLYPIRSWRDLFHDWYEIIIARRVVLTDLITDFSKTRLQFILQHTKCGRKWWFLGALTAEVRHETEPIIVNHIGQCVDVIDITADRGGYNMYTYALTIL